MIRVRLAPAFGLTVIAMALATSIGASTAVNVTLLSTAPSPGGPGPTSVACMSAGNCVASGYSANNQATVQSETGGSWGPPTIATKDLGKIDSSALIAVSCFKSGCVGFGRYITGLETLHFHHFTISYSRGKWTRAVPVSLNLGAAKSFQELSISCIDQRDCAVVGALQYSGQFAKTPIYAPAVLTEEAGRWSAVRPLAARTRVIRGVPEFLDVSCPSSGDCVAVGLGSVHGSLGSIEATETSGHWSTAQRSFPENWTVLSVSCVTEGNCTVSGRMTTSEGGRAFVSWGRIGHGARPVQVGKRWTVSGNSRSSANLVVCQSPNTCVIAGLVDGPSPKVGVSSVAWIATEANGRWSDGALIGYRRGALNQGQVDGLSCPAVGSCEGVGQYWIENSSLEAIQGVHNFAVRLAP